MTSPTKCDTNHKKPIFTISEQKSRATFNNPNRYPVTETRVDGCLITTGIRCDYLISVPAIDTSILLELKGCDVNHAINQITATHTQLSASLHKNKYWLVVSTRCPLASPQLQVLALKIRKSHGAILIVRNTPHSQSI